MNNDEIKRQLDSCILSVSTLEMNLSTLLRQGTTSTQIRALDHIRAAAIDLRIASIKLEEKRK